MRNVRCALAVLAALGLWGCCFSKQQELDVVVAVPQGAARCVVTYVDGVGSNAARCQTLDVTGGGQVALALTVTKSAPVPVLAQFFGPDGDKTGDPLGMIAPYTQEPCRADGFAADILLKLYVGAADDDGQVQDYLARFNWPRFMQECRAFDDPWLLDRGRILLAISAGTFKKGDLRLREDAVEE